MDTEHLTDRITDRFDDLRDRFADSLSAETSEARRALDRTSDTVDRMSDRLGTKIDGLTLEAAKRFDRVEAAIAGDDCRGWVSRLSWIAAGIGLGAAAMYLLDPASGRDRRDDLSDQLGGRASHLADQAQTDPKTLRARIRSEVIGRVDGTDKVVVAVHDSGRVTLKGTVPNRETEKILLERTSGVAGVATVETELDIAA